MANSNMMLVCKHCGEGICIGKGNLGSYYTWVENMQEEMNAFYKKHSMGLCSSGEGDCSDDAKDHFVILEYGDTLDDIKSERAEAIEEFAAMLKQKARFCLLDFNKCEDVHEGVRIVDNLVKEMVGDV